jgi:ferrous iron transport protein A
MNFNSSAVPLTSLIPGQKALVQEVLGPGRGTRLRLAALGLRRGACVRLIRHGVGGPILLEVDGTWVALGRGLARRILVLPQGDAHAAE